MVTLILRLQEDPAGGLKGTVELPGKAPELFRDGEELVAVLLTLAVQDGNGLGSMSNSAMRDT